MSMESSLKFAWELSMTVAVDGLENPSDKRGVYEQKRDD